MSPLPAHSRSEDPAESASGAARLSPLTELQLLQAWRQGDPQALGSLLRGYQGRIYGVCYRLLHDREAAMDLTQESLVRIIEGLPGYDGRSQLSTWMIRVSMNCCLTYLRKQKLRRHGSLEAAADGGSPGPAGEEPSALSRVQQREDREVLVRALDALDPDSRAILVLRDLQALEYQQISEVLDLPLGTVKSRLFRAREALRMEVERLSPSERDEKQK